MNRPFASSRPSLPCHRPGARRKGTALCAAAVAVLGTTLAGCSSTDILSGDKVDYHSASTKTTPLEVPPDLTQLSQESVRYQPQAAGSVSASTYQPGAAAPTAQNAPLAVAPQAVGNVRIERDGNQRWLATSIPPEQLWPQLRSFWQERGFVLAVDQPEAGVMETEWAENHAKLPQDIIRRTIGKVFSDLYSTGERDKFRTRVERTATGSEIYVTHRGMEEVVIGQAKDTTKWQPRQPDPQLEAEFLARLMAKLGGAKDKDKDAKPDTSMVANAPEAAARASIVPGSVSQLRMDEGFNQAWRRVGLALDRTGFTVEDRDRANGVYFVRYIDPKLAGQEEPGFFKKLFGSSDKKAADASLSRYRVAVKGEGNSSTVSVLNAQGSPETGEIGRRIVSVLLEELK